MLLTGLLSALLAASAVSKAPPQVSVQSPGAAVQGDGTVVSRHAVTLRRKSRLSYTARAGFIPLRRDGAGESGELLGEMFFTAYIADQPAGAAPRPLTFVWGGGPGNGASLSASGPRKLKPAAAGVATSVIENPDTWLDVSDLVMIDEMGTGYSRMAKPEFAPLFFTPQTDAEAFTEFMRIYLRRYARTDAPVVLRGGSYGSIRGVLVAAAAERRGIPVRGVILSESAILNDLEKTDLFPPLFVPTFTSTAFFYKKLAPELMADRSKTLAEAEAWASGPYTAALGRGNALSPEQRRAVIGALARYTGLKPEVIEAHDLRISSEVFDNELLRDQGRVIGNYDTRVSVVSGPRTFNPTTDPSLNARGVAMPSLLERDYLSHELGANADLLGSRMDAAYLGPFGGAWPAPTPMAWPASAAASAEWMAVKWGQHGEPIPHLTGVILAETMEKNALLQVLLAGGRYDLATPYYNMRYLQTHVRPAALPRFNVLEAESGHGIRGEELHEAARDLYRAVLATPSPTRAPGIGEAG